MLAAFAGGGKKTFTGKTGAAMEWQWRTKLVKEKANIPNENPLADLAGGLMSTSGVTMANL